MARLTAKPYLEGTDLRAHDIVRNSLYRMHKTTVSKIAERLYDICQSYDAWFSDQARRAQSQ